ncbi:MAG: LptA/OstA family protein [Chthoniobacterales bacterium]
MRTLAILIFALFSGAALAQTADGPSLGGQPVEITSTGGTTYDNGLAIARENVAIHTGDADIYADRAEYNTTTKEIRLQGNVRIYRGFEFYTGERAIYNTETKVVQADSLRTLDAPFFVGGETISTQTDGARLVEKANFTTHDSAKPDFQIRATTVRVYEGDRVVLKNATFYVGNVPIFYWPYLYQSLDDSSSFVVSPAYMSSWGPSLLGRVTFPITTNIKAKLRLDYRGRRGAAIGFDPDIVYGKEKKSYARIRTYFALDQNPQINRTSLPRGSLTDKRYRVSLEDRTFFTSDIEGFAKLTKLSDAFVLQDFFQGEFRLDPQPDNVVSVTKTSPRFVLTAYTRFQMNNFFETTERLPEVALDVIRQPVLNSPLFYEGDSSVSLLRRNFARGATLRGSLLQDYDAFRADTFHQFLYPNTYFGWLSVVPRVGFRATYYSDTRDLANVVQRANPNALIPDFLIEPPSALTPLLPGGDRFRTVVNAGVEASFKISRTWEEVQSRTLGLDGLRHIAQPFVNFSYVTGNNFTPAEILQFDRYIPSTRLRPIDFPQFTSIDSLDNWSIMRFGFRNRLQTRRDDITFNWLELESYFDLNFDNPYNKSNYSNIYNNIRFNPVPWISLGISSQLPVLGDGFTEVNTDVRVQPAANLQLAFGHRFLNESPFFANSSLYTAGAYYRIDDNWAGGASLRYEASTGFVEEQRYTVYRDLTSWVASVGAIIRNNGGVKEYGVLLTFTLKALPKFSFDLNFDPGASEGEGQNGLLPTP